MTRNHTLKEGTAFEILANTALNIDMVGAMFRLLGAHGHGQAGRSIAMAAVTFLEAVEAARALPGLPSDIYVQASSDCKPQTPKKRAQGARKKPSGNRRRR